MGATLPDIQATLSHPRAVPCTHQPSVTLLREYCPWLLTKFVPENVGANGNCLFRAISFLLYATEHHHTQLRVLCAIEVLLNSALYDCDSSAFYAPFAADMWLKLPAFSEFVVELVRYCIQRYVVHSGYQYCCTESSSDSVAYVAP